MRQKSPLALPMGQIPEWESLSTKEYHWKNRLKTVEKFRFAGH